MGRRAPARSTAPAPFVAAYRDPAFLASLATSAGPRHLDDDFELVQDTFRRFAEDKIRPVAEHIHRHNADIPEDDHRRPGRDRRLRPVGPRGVRRLRRRRRVRLPRHGRRHRGAVPGLARRRRLAHHPARDPHPGPREGRHRGAEAASGCPSWPSAEVMAAVAVTEPDFGSDVAGIKVTATPTDGGWLINGVKTWCTFGARADVLMLLARTDPDRSQEPPRPVAVRRAQAARRRPRLRAHPGGGDGAPGGGKMEGRADRHHRLPRHALLRGRLRRLVRARRQPRRRRGRARARASTSRWPGFENGRLQTAARAVGVMQAAYEAARQYALDRDGVRPARSPTTSSPRPSSPAWP